MKWFSTSKIWHFKGAPRNWTYIHNFVTSISRKASILSIWTDGSRIWGHPSCFSLLPPLLAISGPSIFIRWERPRVLSRASLNKFCEIPDHLYDQLLRWNQTSAWTFLIMQGVALWKLSCSCLINQAEIPLVLLPGFFFYLDVNQETNIPQMVVRGTEQNLLLSGQFYEMV